MNWTSAIIPQQWTAPQGTVREHICADDFNKERALRIASLRAKARDKIRATIAAKKNGRIGSR